MSEKERRGRGDPTTEAAAGVVQARFRPILEDLVEFAIVEGFAGAREGWQEALEGHRASWTEIQLKTLVRDNQTTAAAELHGRGWTVIPPPGQLEGSPNRSDENRPS